MTFGNFIKLFSGYSRKFSGESDFTDVATFQGRSLPCIGWALQFYFTYAEVCKGTVIFEQAPGSWRGGNVLKLAGKLVKCSHDFITIEGNPVHV